MPITLSQLTASGPSKQDAQVNFKVPATLIFGPSDTGKSHIRDCLWYLLGGEKPIKKIIEGQGYDTLILLFEANGERYEVRRAIAGGNASLTKLKGDPHREVREALDEDVGELLVKLAGAQGKQLLRSKSKKGLVTGGDLRHWFLLSQPGMISEDPTYGREPNTTQRISAFHLFLTGIDDSAIQLTKTTKEIDRVVGQLAGAELSLERTLAGIPEGRSKEEIADALGRVDIALDAMTHHYVERASQLKKLRQEILITSNSLAMAMRERDHSIAMVERFELLDCKYQSDRQRLEATWEGMAMFQALDETPCPLCGTAAEAQADPGELRQDVQDRYRKALQAEIQKITVLHQGLAPTLFSEQERASLLSDKARDLSVKLEQLEGLEKQCITETKFEFYGDPKSLALQRSELSDYLSSFDEVERLSAEIENLTKLKRREKITVNRNVGDANVSIAERAKKMLHQWGFGNIQNVFLDTATCDLIIDGQARLNYGAGKRSVFLTALTISVMQHALERGHPHLGVVVIDSPLKSYADPKNKERDVPTSTLTERFYKWLAEWKGPGQIVILENQEASSIVKHFLDSTEFIGDSDTEGRRGFYPT